MLASIKQENMDQKNPVVTILIIESSWIQGRDALNGIGTVPGMSSVRMLSSKPFSDPLSLPNTFPSHLPLLSFLLIKMPIIYVLFKFLEWLKQPVPKIPFCWGAFTFFIGTFFLSLRHAAVNFPSFSLQGFCTMFPVTSWDSFLLFLASRCLNTDPQTCWDLRSLHRPSGHKHNCLQGSEELVPRGAGFTGTI